MGKILGIDYGSKRIGLAITDDARIISSPLDVISNVEIFKFLDKFLNTEDVECFIIGMSKRLNNSDNLISKDIHIFAQKISKKFQIPVHFVDERYTSKIASTIIVNSHLKKIKRRDKKIVDKISASLILETYLNLIKK